MSDLDKLIEAVESGWFAMDVLSPDHEGTAYGAFSGDLNAAKRLHDALLPWDARVNDMAQDGKGRWYVVIACDVAPHYFHGDDDNPARAWLLSILRAVKAKGAGE